MLASRQNNNKIKQLHERCMRRVQNDKLLSYEEFLERYGSVVSLSIIQSFYSKGLPIETFQMKHGQSHEVVTDNFTQTTKESNFRQNRDFRIPSVNTVYHGSESTSYIGSEIWEIALAKSLKKEIRNCVP